MLLRYRILVLRWRIIIFGHQYPFLLIHPPITLQQYPAWYFLNPYKCQCTYLWNQYWASKRWKINRKKCIWRLYILLHYDRIVFLVLFLVQLKMNNNMEMNNTFLGARGPHWKRNNCTKIKWSCVSWRYLSDNSICCHYFWNNSRHWLGL